MKADMTDIDLNMNEKEIADISKDAFKNILQRKISEKAFFWSVRTN